MFLLMMRVSMENTLLLLEQVLCICYSIWFKKNKVQALTNSDSEVNTMISAYTLEVSFKVCSPLSERKKLIFLPLKHLE